MAPRARRVRGTMAAAQPSRHSVCCRGAVFLAPSCGAAPTSGLGSREVPLALALLGTALTADFYTHVASSPATRALTLLLWAVAIALALRITCRDPGVLPRAWQIKQCAGLREAHGKALPGAARRSATVCSTCDIVRPDGASHCSCCDACVAGFDHHCWWLGVCVGARNHADFLWLLYHGVLCASFAAHQSWAVLAGPLRDSALLRHSRARAPPGLWGAALAAMRPVAAPADALFRRWLAHPAVGYLLLGMLITALLVYHVAGTVVALLGRGWLRALGRLDLLLELGQLLLGAAVGVPLAAWMLGEAAALHGAAAMRHSELTAALVLTLVLLLLPLWVRTPSCCCRIYLVYFK